MAFMGTNSKNSSSVSLPASAAVIPTRNITPAQIDPDALKVVRRLRRFGYSAYLVGGCVRDLLLKRNPKDFDVATSAHPNEIRKLFRNCRLIGRRFRLAHIHFQGKVIETATFRGAAEAESAGGTLDSDLLIRSDNVFGSEEEDARRRDFSINALFYDPVDRVLIDHVGGLEDLVSRTVRFIGDPAIRVCEDPVRMLRAIKFAARLDFVIEKSAWEAIVRFRGELTKSASPRILEEFFRMLRGGGAEGAFRLMWKAELLQVLLPQMHTYLRRSLERKEEKDPGAGLWAYLRAIDQWDGPIFSDPVLMACLLIHPVQDATTCCDQSYGIAVSGGTVGDAAQQLLPLLASRLRLPKWQAERIMQLMSCQKRLLSVAAKEPLPRSLLRRAYIPEAMELLRIGMLATGSGQGAWNRLHRLPRSFFENPPVSDKKFSPNPRRRSRGRRHPAPRKEK
jgi:poly(A) polymerase